ncbi:glycosyltransferase [Paraflavisolibacter sp. H34]|uniref:glycosyltransferase n=1 Tax=Huijunlia imazamoxiresistens TaxID=3127457 RepID=UPI003018DDB4
MLSKSEFEKLPLFITTMSRWDGSLSSASLALAKVFSQTNPVYYIDYPITYADFLREYKTPGIRRRLPALVAGRRYLTPVPGQPENLVAATPKLVIPSYSLPAGPVADRVMHHNNKVVAALVRRILKEKGLRDYLFLNSFNPGYLSRIRQYLDPTLAVYQSRDAVEDSLKDGIAKENECVQQYDLSVATSLQLCRNISARNQRPVHYLPNGGDISLFRKAQEQEGPRPADLQDVRTPIIGYTGAVCQRMDYELLLKMAKAHPDKTIVLVGPLKKEHLQGIDLSSQPNILCTGAKRIEELPAYLRCFDCAVIPFLRNNLTGGIYPLKINEYLAAGCPVLTTHFSEDIASFSDQVYLARSHDEFLALLPQALGDHSPERRRQRLAAAAGNSWERRVETFWQLAWEAYRQKHGSPARNPIPQTTL